MVDEVKRVLVLAYYFPPLSLSGVQRVVGFVKHFPDYGWHPTVITAKPAGYFAYDPELLKEVESGEVEIHATRSLDPTRLFPSNRIVSLPSEPVRSRVALISQMVFIPDNKVGWIPFAVRRGLKLHKRRPFDVIFASAPPYSGLLAALRLKRHMGVPLIIDFRDDWIGNPLHRYPTRLHRTISASLEKKVIGITSAITTINGVIRDSFLKRYPEISNISVLPHGYDVSLNRVIRDKENTGNRMVILYTGIFYDAQKPDYFLKALALIAKEFPGIINQIDARFLGLLPRSAMNMIDQLGLQRFVSYGGYVSHKEAMAAQQDADILWMTIGDRPCARGISTSKLSEYMGCRKPILALIPPGDAQQTLERYEAAYIVGPQKVDLIAQTIVKIFHDWKKGILPVHNEEFVSSRTQKHITGKLVRYFEASLK